MKTDGYDWKHGAILKTHTQKKHIILKDYIFEYIQTRCSKPQQERFRLAIVDGFSGGGRYRCGSPGSPLIFMETLAAALNAVNLKRSDQGIKPVHIQCLLIANDEIPEVIEILKQNIAPVHAQVKDSCRELEIEFMPMSGRFEDV